MRAAINTLLTLLVVMAAIMVSVTESYANECLADVEFNESLRWNKNLYGDRAIFCSSGCSYLPQILLDFDDENITGSSWISDGSTCDGDGLKPNGYIPPPPAGSDNNGNGIDDSIEDFDGDGIANAVDPEPFIHSSSSKDVNQNGIPDQFEQFIDELDIDVTYNDLTCNTAGCPNALASIAIDVKNVAHTNQELAESLKDVLSNQLDRHQFGKYTENIANSIKLQNDKINDTRLLINEKLNQLGEKINNSSGGGGSNGLFTQADRDIVSNINANSEQQKITNIVNQNIMNGIMGNQASLLDQMAWLPNNVATEVNSQVSQTLNNGVNLKKTQTNQLKNVNNKANTINTRTTRIETKVDTALVKLDTNQSILTDVKSQIDKVLDVSNKTFNVSSSNSDKLDEANQLINNIQTSIDEQTTDIAYNATLLGTLQGTLDVVDEKLAELSTSDDISSLTAQLTNLDTYLKAMDAKIDKLSEGDGSGTDPDGGSGDTCKEEDKVDGKCPDTGTDGGSGTDLTAVETGIDGINSKLGNIGSGLTGIAGTLKSINKAVSGESRFTQPENQTGFEGDFIFNSAVEMQLNLDIDKLKEELDEEISKFKGLLSLDTSGFQSGEFKEHTLDMTIEGKKHSFKTGVLSALVDNSEFIKAIVIFIFVLIGIKMLGNE